MSPSVVNYESVALAQHQTFSMAFHQLEQGPHNVTRKRRSHQALA